MTEILYFIDVIYFLKMFARYTSYAGADLPLG